MNIQLVCVLAALLVGISDGQLQVLRGNNSIAVVHHGGRRELFCGDAPLLNGLIDCATPGINRKIQTSVPEPFDVNFTRKDGLGNVTTRCGGSNASLVLGLGGIDGLSTFFIDSLDLIPSSEKLCVGCILTEWAATFALRVRSQGNFTMRDITSGFETFVCNRTTLATVATDITVTNFSLSGRIDLGGRLIGCSINIDKAQVLDSLDISFDGIEVSFRLADVPENLRVVVERAKRIVRILIRYDIFFRRVEPFIRNLIEEKMNGTQLFSPATALSANGGFIRNAAVRGIGGLFQGAVDFFG